MVARVLAIAVILCGCVGQDGSNQPPVDEGTAQLIMRAEQAVNASRLDEAQSIIDSLERSGSGLAEGRLLRAKLLAVEGRFEEAQAAYETLIEEGFAPAGVHHNAGEIAFRRNRFREALAHFDVELERQETAMTRHASGIVYERLARPDSARLAHERAIELDPSFAPAEQSLARWHEQAGAYETALRHIDRAIELDPGNEQYRANRALLLSLAAHDSEALPALEEVLRSNPADYATRFAYARSLRRVGRVDEADRELLLAEESRDVMAEIELLRASVADLPQNDRMRRDLADRLRGVGHYDEALVHYAVLSRRNPDNLEIRGNLATLHMQTGDTGEALRQYGRILETDSTHVETWLNLGYHYARVGERDRATDAWRRAIAYGPDHPGVEKLRELAQPAKDG